MCVTETCTPPDFYKLAAENGVPVVNFPLPQTGSIAVDDGENGIIGMDSTRRWECGEEQAHLGHELGHCLYGGFYDRETACDMIERHEVRADRWYILKAIPRETLLGLLKQGYDAWEIAERLNTTEDYVRQAYYYYKDNA
jgi:hypothetical protein